MFDLDSPVDGEPEFSGSPFGEHEDIGGDEQLEAAGEEVESESEEQAEAVEVESESEEQAKSEPAPKAVVAEEPPAWAIKMQEQNAANMTAFTEALALFAPKKEAKVEAPPEEFSVDAIMRAGLKASGIDPDSEEGEQIAYAAGMSKARRHFGEDDHGKIDETIKNATSRGRRTTAANKVEQTLEALRARVENMELGGSRSRTFTLVSKNLATMAETYPLASKANEYGVKMWLDQSIEGAPDNDKLHEAIQSFDDFLSEYDTSNPVELRAAQRAFKSMNDWRAELFDGLIANAGKSADSEPELKAKLTAKLAPKSKRPSVPRGTDGGSIDDNNDLARKIFNASDPDELDMLTEQSYAAADAKFKGRGRKPRLMN